MCLGVIQRSHGAFQVKIANSLVQGTELDEAASTFETDVDWLRQVMDHWSLLILWHCTFFQRKLPFSFC